MYNLSFASAHQLFEQWVVLHPEDPRGPLFDAAAYLFSEFERMRILQSDFFLEDDNFREGRRPGPDNSVRQRFEAALLRADTLADAVLAKSPNDRTALFSKVMARGLEADYEALIAKQEFRAVASIKTARQTADRLLSIHPDCYDAHLAAGVENYLLSQRLAPVRWVLRLGGVGTDKEKGLSELRIVAENGNYLQPYAKLLLAVAALRDNNRAEARRLLQDLASRYPLNPLYREELRKIGS